MLIELQTSLVDKSILSRAKLLANGVDQWASILSQSNSANGKFSGTANGHLIIEILMSYIKNLFRSHYQEIPQKLVTSDKVKGCIFLFWHQSFAGTD